jgi:Calcineurin-like phosphoesterase
MFKSASDEGSVQQHVAAVRGLLHSDALAGAVAGAAQQIPGGGDAATKVMGVLPGPDTAQGSSGGAHRGVPYFSRDPLVSLIQSSVEENMLQAGAVDVADRHGLWGWILRLADRWLNLQPGSFKSDDPNWYIDIAKASLEHLARGNHAFNTAPAEHQISDTARLVIVGDWGTGIRRARDVAALMQQEVAGALARGREAHVIHLGDVYYSGLPSEDQRRFLAFWPVTADQARAGVTSWSLNGNHDMYSGGFGYFGTLLGDQRFAAQRSPDGQTTSFFRLTSPSWEFLGLDTAWDSDVLTKGGAAVLEDPQAGYVSRVAGESKRKMVLFSHHQLVSVYDKEDITPELSTKLAPVLTGDRVTAWWWGHEHRALAYRAADGVHYPRCLGNGGVPILRPPALNATTGKLAEWESRRYIWSGGQQWARFGFAVLDLNGDSIDVRYRDDDGTQTYHETVA